MKFLNLMDSPLGFHADRKITDVLKERPLTLSAEVIPPRNGAEHSKILQQIRLLVDSGAEFLAVTKGAGGSLRGGSLPIAQSIKEQFHVPCVAHFACRDLTPEECENQLMDHHYFGIRNILALRGDPPNNQPDWTPRENSYQYAHQLIAQIKNLNEGQFLPRPGGRAVEQQTRTDFCVGAAVYPEHPNLKERLDFYKMKVDAGADFGITQMCFEAEKYAQFVELCQKNGIDTPILPGTRVLKSKTQAINMRDRFGVSVSENFLAHLPEKSDPDSIHHAVDLFMELAEKLKSYGAPGIHLFVLSDTNYACEALRRLANPS